MREKKSSQKVGCREGTGGGDGRHVEKFENVVGWGRKEELNKSSKGKIEEPADRSPDRLKLEDKKERKGGRGGSEPQIMIYLIQYRSQQPPSSTLPSPSSPLPSSEQRASSPPRPSSPPLPATHLLRHPTPEPSAEPNPLHERSGPDRCRVSSGGPSFPKERGWCVDGGGERRFPTDAQRGSKCRSRVW